MNIRQLTATRKTARVASVRTLQQWNHLKDRVKFVQQPIKTNFGWKGWDCELSLDSLQRLTELVRCITARLTKIAERNLEASYQPATEKIASAIKTFLSDFPGSAQQSTDHKTLLEWVTVNIGLIPATRDGYDLLRSAYDQLVEADAQLGKNSPAPALEPVVTEKQLEQLLRFFERNRDLRIPIPGFDIKVALRRLRSTSRE